MSAVMKPSERAPIPSLFELVDGLGTLSDPDISQLIRHLDAERHFIRTCLDDARAQDIYDPGWYRRANLAYHYKGVSKHYLGRELLRRRNDPANPDGFSPTGSLPRLFMQMAQEHLDADVFDALYRRAHAAWLEDFNQDKNAPALAKKKSQGTALPPPQKTQLTRQQINQRLRQIEQLLKTGPNLSLRQCR